MPRGDRTGPMGMGPMTGRAAGYCAGYPVPGYMNPWPGACGGWFGGGWYGRGWRHRRWYYAMGLPGWVHFGAPCWGPWAPPISPEAEAQFLRQQAEWLKSQLEAIQSRLEELEKKEGSASEE